MRTIICLMTVVFIGCSSDVETYSVTPKLVVNDCSYAVEQHPTMQIDVSGDQFNFGWHDIKRLDEENFGRRFVSRHVLHSTPSGFELMILETVTFNGKICDSMYLGNLR